MRKRILRQIAETAFRFSGLVLVILILLTAMSISGLRRLRIDTGLSDFLPPGSPQARLIGEVVDDYRNLEPLVVDVQGSAIATKSDLTRIADALAELIDDPTYFTRVAYKIDSWEQERHEAMSDSECAALLTEKDWEVFRSWVQERARDTALPEGLGFRETVREMATPVLLPIPVKTWRGYYFSEDGRSIRILLDPVRSADDAYHAVRTSIFLAEARQFLLDRNPDWSALCTIAYRGNHIETAEKIHSMMRSLGFIMGSSLIFVLALLILMFRKGEALVFTLLPPTLGMLWTLGLTHVFCVATEINVIHEGDVVYTRVTGVTAAFLLITFGIGLSYSIHLFHRFTMELYHHRNYYRALQISYMETGRGVLASGLITSLIFFSLFLTSFRGLKELGTMAGVATLCNVASCLLTIPMLAGLKRRLAKGRIHPVALYRMNLTWLWEPAIRAPRATIGAMALLTIVLGADLSADGLKVIQLDLHPRFSSIAAYFFRPEASTEHESGSRPRPGRPLVAIVEGTTFEDALESNDRLYRILDRLQNDDDRRFGILAVDSLRRVLPSMRTQRNSFLQLQSLEIETDEIAIDENQKQNETDAKVDADTDARKKFFGEVAALQELSRAWKPSTLSADSSQALLRSVWRLATTKDNRFQIATPIYPGPEGFTRDQVDNLTTALEPMEGSIKLIGDPLVERELLEGVRYDLAQSALLSAVSIFIALIFHFRGLRPAWIAFVCILAQVLWIGGMMHLSNLTLHILTLMAIPLAVTLAVDNSIHIIQHFRDHGSTDIRLTVVILARSVVLSCGVLGLLYGTLSLSEFEGLRDLGLVAFFGSVATLVATLMLLPAMLRLWGRGQPILNILNPPHRLDRD